MKVAKTNQELANEVKKLRTRVSTLEKSRRQRAQIEKSRQEVEQFNQEVISGAGEGIAVYDREFRYTVWNTFMENMTGVRASKVLGKKGLDIFPHLREQGVDRLLERALAGKVVRSPDTRFYVPQTGRVGWVVGTYAPHRDFEGSVIGVVATIHDISDRKRVEEALLRSEQYAHSMIDSSMDMIITVDNEFRIVEFNKAAQETFGYPRDEVIGRPVDLLYADQAAGRAVHQVTLERGENSQDVLNMRKNGEVFVSHVSAATMRDARGALLGIVEVSRDITERKRAEEALAREQYLLYTLLENIPDHIYFKDAQSHFIRINKAHAKALGLSDPTEVIGKTDFDFFTEVHAKKAYEDEQRIIQMGRPMVGLEEQQTWPNRPDTWVSTTKLPLRDTKGNIVGTFGISRDITGRKRADEALRLAEEKYRSIFDYAIEGIFQTTPAGCFLTTNSALARMLGYASPQELISSITDIAGQVYADPAMRSEFRCRMEEQGEVHAREFQVSRKDGSLMWVSENSRAVRNANGELVCYEGTIQNITARKEAEEALRQSEERFSGAFEYAAIGMAFVSSTGRFLKVNPALCELTGYSANELLSQTFQDITHPDDLNADLACVRQMLAGEIHTYQMEKRYFHKSGRVVWALLSVSLVRDVQGKPLHFISQIEDITARKESEDALHHRADEFAALYDIARDLAVQSDQATLLQTIVGRASRLLAAYGGGIYLYERERGDLNLVTSTGSELAAGHRLRLGEGLAGRVAQTRQPIMVNDYSQWEHRSAEYAEIQFTAVVEVPMLYGGDLIGVLVVYEVGTVARKFSDADARLLSLFAGQAASAVHNARLLDETRQRAQRQEALYRISTSLTHLRGARELCETVVRDCSDLLNYPFLGIFLLDPNTGDRILQAQRGWDQAPKDWRLHPGEGVSQAAVLSGQVHYCTDVTQEPNYVAGKGGYHSELDIPIKVDDTVLGVLIIEDLRIDAFSQGDMDVLQAVANQLAVALENVRLYSEQQQLAMLDSLTGLFNRRHFAELAQREFMRAHRQKSPCAVLMIDMNHFKHVNDTLGHLSGDEALCLVAKTLAKNVRGIDLVARYGGDEFVILLPDCHLAEAGPVAKRLLEEGTLLRISNADQSVSLSFSIGIAVATLEPDETLDTLLSRADTEMYKNKQQRSLSGGAL